MNIQLGVLNLGNIIPDTVDLEHFNIGAVNVIFILAVIILLSGFIKGCKAGFAAEVISLISLFVSVAALIVLIRSLREYISKDMVSVAIGIISLIVIVLVYKIVSFILEALKLLSKIPIIKWGDALVGGAVGIVEGIVVIWILFTVIILFRFGSVNAYVMEAVAENTVLTFLFRNNYVAYFVAGIL